MLFSAKCVKLFKDKNGDAVVYLCNDYGDNFYIKAKYCTKVPSAGARCICRVRACHFEDSYFLGYDVVEVV